MPSANDAAITELMTDAAAALKTLNQVAEANASDEVQAGACQAYMDVLHLIGRHSIASYEGRTALLTGLFTELNEVTRSVDETNPVAGHVDALEALSTKALELFKEEKKAEASGS